MLNFDAASLTDLQACPRRYILNQSWRPLRWNPRYLFDAILRRAVLHLSQKQDSEKVRQVARSQYLQSAANPGIDVPDPYPVAMEYVTLLDVLVETLSRVGVPQELREGDTRGSWQVSAFLDTYGCPHRYLTVDHWDESRQRSELHSWWVAGDLAVLDKPLTLHVIEIGQMRSGQRASLWVRGYRNPKVPNVRRVRFIPKSERSFKGWAPARLADLHIDVESWVEMLFADDVPRQLTRTIQVEPADPQKRAAVLADLEAEAARVDLLAPDWCALPMHRGACDSFVPCPFQSVCYDGADPATSGLYVIRETPKPLRSGDAAGQPLPFRQHGPIQRTG